MNGLRNIVKNSGASLVTQIARPLSTFALVFFIARYLGVTGIGQFSSALSLLYIFQAFCSLGFPLLITRDVAQNKALAAKYLVNSAMLGIGCSLIMIPAMVMVVNIISDSDIVRKAVYVLSFSLIPYSLCIVCNSISRAFERLEYITISEIGGGCFRVVTGLYFLFKGYGLVFLMGVIAFSYFVHFCISLYLAMLSTRKMKYEFDMELCKTIAIAVPMFGAITVVSTLRWNVDMLILTKLMSEQDVGYYGAAIRLFNIAKLGLGCFVAALQPAIFRLYRTSIEKFVMACEESVRYILIIIIPITVGGAMLSERLVSVVFGSEFAPAAQALKISIWILVFSGENLILAHALIASGYQRVNLYGNLLNLAANVGLNLVLIPRYGFVGASVASLASSLVIMSYQWYFVSKRLFRVNFIAYCIRPALASGLMGIYISAVSGMNLPLLIFSACIVYFAALIPMRAFGRKDMELVRELWTGRREVSSTGIASDMDGS